MSKKISEKLTRLRICYQTFLHDYWEAARLLENEVDNLSRINLKLCLEKSLLLKEFTQGVPKEELPEIIRVAEARGGVSLPISMGGMEMDMGVRAREAEYYLPRVHMTFVPKRVMGFSPLREYCPGEPEFMGVEKLLEKGRGLYLIHPIDRESFEYWCDGQIGYRAFDPEKVDIIINALEKHLAGSPAKQKLEELKQKIQKAENRRQAETEEAEKKYYSLLAQRISNLTDALVDYSWKYRVIGAIEYGEFDSDVREDKEGRRKFFLIKEKKLIFAPYKVFFGVHTYDSKKATDLPDRQWLRFSGMLDFTLLKYLSEKERDFITSRDL